MAGVEALGIAASAVQLAQLGLAIVTSLSSLFIQIHDMPKTLQSRILQVQTLVEIARLVASMPQLQTLQVEEILKSCLREAEVLRKVLQELAVGENGPLLKKWVKGLGGVVMERKFVRLLQTLEVEKSALVLCITSIDS
jgi:hypothetical protein